MYKLYLRADSEEQMRQGIPWAVNAQGEWITTHANWSLDPIGTIHIPAVVDVEGREITPAIPLAGWHLNLLLPDTSLLSVIPPEFTIEVTSPVRTWAGMGEE